MTVATKMILQANLPARFILSLSILVIYQLYRQIKDKSQLM